ncbi:hypothetical protein Tco_1511055 [Tanacetum coccineum]
MVVVHNEDASRCTAWTNEEEIILCKGWFHVSENNAKGNAMKVDGFWTEAHSSGAEDGDYFAKALLDYEAEFGVPFTLHHCWEVLRHSLKWWEKEVPRDEDEDDM